MKKMSISKTDIMKLVNDRISLMNATEITKEYTDSQKCSFVIGHNINLDNCEEGEFEYIKWLIPNGVGLVKTDMQDENAIEPTEEPIEEPTEELVEEPIEELVEEPIEELVEEPIEEPTEEPIEEPVEEPVEEPTVEPNEESINPSEIIPEVEE